MRLILQISMSAQYKSIITKKASSFELALNLYKILVSFIISPYYKK